MSEEKRDVPRTPIPGPIKAEITVFQPIEILDISERGAQVETPFKLQLDSLHDFRLALGIRSVVLKGRIAYCQICELGQGGVMYRSGIEFVEPPPHARSAIAAFVEELRAARALPSIIDGKIAEDNL